MLEGGGSAQMRNFRTKKQKLAKAPKQGTFLLAPFLLTACGGGGGASPTAPQTPQAIISGTVVDGYIEGATVFLDENNNGVLDAGEVSGTTDENGDYSFSVDEGRSGTIVSIGGIDVSTGISYEDVVLTAPDGATVISPLTTLLTQGVDVGALRDAFGIDDSIDLTSFDPVAALGDGDANANAVLLAGQEVMLLVQSITALLEGAGVANEDGELQSAVLAAVAAAIVDDGSANFTDNSVLESLINGLDTADVLADTTVYAASQSIVAVVQFLRDSGGDLSDGNKIAAIVGTDILPRDLHELAEGSLSTTEIQNTYRNNLTELSDRLQQVLDDAPYVVNGQQIDPTDYQSYFVGTEAADSLYGTDGNDFMFGGQGDDELGGGQGDDFIYGGAGNDTLYGSVDDNILVGGTGNDDLRGGFHDDILAGDEGNDRLIGERGEDLLIGGTGDDVLIGDDYFLEKDEDINSKGYSDIFRHNPGDGHDIVLDINGGWELIYDEEQGGWQDGFKKDSSLQIIYRDVDSDSEYTEGIDEIISDSGEANGDIEYGQTYDRDTQTYYDQLYYLAPDGYVGLDGVSGTDILEFGEGIELEDLYMEWQGGGLLGIGAEDLVLGYTTSDVSPVNFDDLTDSVELRDWATAKGIEEIHFADGTIIYVDDIEFWGAGHDFIDEISGSEGADWIAGNGHNDILKGMGGDDIVNGNQGVDYIDGGAGSDLLIGGSNEDGFHFGQDSLDGSTDRILDYELGEPLFLTSILTDYDENSDLGQWIDLSYDIADDQIVLKIDADGEQAFDAPDLTIILEGGQFFSDLADLVDSGLIV